MAAAGDRGLPLVSMLPGSVALGAAASSRLTPLADTAAELLAASVAAMLAFVWVGLGSGAPAGLRPAALCIRTITHTVDGVNSSCTPGVHLPSLLNHAPGSDITLIFSSYHIWGTMRQLSATYVEGSSQLQQAR